MRDAASSRSLSFWINSAAMANPTESSRFASGTCYCNASPHRRRVGQTELSVLDDPGNIEPGTVCPG